MTNEIINLVNEVLSLNNTNFDLEEDLSNYGLTSMNLVSIVVDLEEKFNIEFPDEFLIIDNLNTINKIQVCIEKLLK